MERLDYQQFLTVLFESGRIDRAEFRRLLDLYDQVHYSEQLDDLKARVEALEQRLGLTAQGAGAS